MKNLFYSLILAGVSIPLIASPGPIVQASGGATQNGAQGGTTPQNGTGTQTPPPTGQSGNSGTTNNNTRNGKKSKHERNRRNRKSQTNDQNGTATNPSGTGR
ncbi:MAG: hypothetical protein ACRD4Q_11890 [Candidatus Acidiferrales bacterium]